jgi:hypothetical protein
MFETQPDKFILHCVACLEDVQECKCACYRSEFRVTQVLSVDDWTQKKEERDAEVSALVESPTFRKSVNIETKEESGIAPMPKRPYYQRHHDDEIIDKIEIEIVPRLKESGLSGDEWRVSAITKLYRKGHLLADHAYSSLESAVAHLPWFNRVWRESSDDSRWGDFIQIEDKFCHQPGCAQRATRVFELKQEYDRRRGRIVNDEDCQFFRNLRSFCESHAERGDCGLEDADNNYIDVTDEFITKPKGGVE